MKRLIIIASIVLSGCSTLGNIEGTGRVGEVLRSIDKTNSVLTGQVSSRTYSSKINRAVGHTKALQQKIDGEFSWVTIIRDVKDLSRYTQ